MIANEFSRTTVYWVFVPNPKLIACRVMIEEMRPFLPQGMAIETLEVSLHTRPERLREHVQRAIDELRETLRDLFAQIYVGDAEFFDEGREEGAADFRHHADDLDVEVLLGVVLEVFEIDRHGELAGGGVKRLVVCGLATDYCVKATALDGVRLGYETAVLLDAIRAVDLEQRPGRRGGRVAHSPGVFHANRHRFLATHMASGGQRQFGDGCGRHGQGEHGDEGERRAAFQNPYAVSQVLPESLQGCPSPRGAGVLHQ